MKAKEYLALLPFPCIFLLIYSMIFLWLIHRFVLFFQAVPKSKGQALADEYGIKFFETVRCDSKLCYTLIYIEKCLILFIWLTLMSLLLQSAKTNLNVEEVFFSIAKDIKQRLADTDAKAEVRLSFRFYFHCHHHHRFQLG